MSLAGHTVVRAGVTHDHGRDRFARRLAETCFAFYLRRREEGQGDPACRRPAAQPTLALPSGHPLVQVSAPFPERSPGRRRPASRLLPTAGQGRGLRAREEGRSVTQRPPGPFRDQAGGSRDTQFELPVRLKPCCCVSLRGFGRVYMS